MIEHLFSKGNSTMAFPLKMLYDFIEEKPSSLKAGVTVSSRKFKKAVDRNRVKRVIRESYRLQKSPLKELLITKEKSLVLFFIYVGKELPVYDNVYDKMGLLMQKLIKEILTKNNID